MDQLPSQSSYWLAVSQIGIHLMEFRGPVSVRKAYDRGFALPVFTKHKGEDKLMTCMYVWCAGNVHDIHI